MRLLPFGLLDRWLAPPPDARRTAWLGEQAYAHRGLHDGMWDGPLLENALPAFTAAIAAGHGIECDIQRSADNRAVVFHDFSLGRLTLAKGRVASKTAAELTQIRLLGQNGAIPELGAMLGVVRGRTPIIVEIKAEKGHVAPLCLAVRRSLEGYGGKAAVMSFDPAVAAWFRRNAAHIVRGLVVTEEDQRGWQGNLRRHRDLWQAKPDFLAYDVRDLPSRFAAAQRVRGLPVLTWTVRSEEQHAIAAEHADAAIFERGAPDHAAVAS
jgi:glycerophosphoryl diester phosphodiesterase